MGSDLGSQALELAQDVFEQERILEYECYTTTKAMDKAAAL
jgi:hypothetical protein